MSDEENENENTEAKDPIIDDTPEVTIPEDALAFLDKLKQNQIAQARHALIHTLSEDTEQTIGSILEALEVDPDGDYIMLEMFKKLTINELVLSVAGGPKAEAPDVPAPLDEVVAAEASIEREHAELNDDDEEDDELDDDDEFVGEGDETPPPKPKKKKSKKSKEEKAKKDKKKKKKSKKGDEPKEDKKPKKAKKSKKDDEPKKTKPPKNKVTKKDVSKKDVFRYLKEVKAKDEDSAVSSESMRKDLKCDADVLRPLLAELLEEDKIEKYGKARGTKYCRT